jgi:hypothetical protein
MPRARVTFRQRDLARAYKTARADGLSVERTLILPNGTFALVHKSDAVVDPAEAALEAFLAEKANRNAR